MHYEAIKFDGQSISLPDLKTAIVGKLGMKAADFDLKIVNTQTDTGVALTRFRTFEVFRTFGHVVWSTTSLAPTAFVRLLRNSRLKLPVPLDVVR